MMQHIMKHEVIPWTKYSYIILRWP